MEVPRRSGQGLKPFPEGLSSKEEELEEPLARPRTVAPSAQGWRFKDWPHLSRHSCAGSGDGGLLAKSDST